MLGFPGTLSVSLSLSLSLSSWPPPPSHLTVSLNVKYLFFFTTSLVDVNFNFGMSPSNIQRSEQGKFPIHFWHIFLMKMWLWLFCCKLLFSASKSWPEILEESVLYILTKLQLQYCESSPVRYIDMTYRLSIYRHFWKNIDIDIDIDMEKLKISISISISIGQFWKISISISISIR